MRPMAIALLAVFGLIGVRVHAETATEREALNMAQNWVTRVIAKYGSWGGSSQAKVTSIEPFTRGDKKLGYFCRVEPRGYLVVSLHKELAPVKAYSETDTADPSSDEGMMDVIKLGLERMIEAAEARLGGSMTIPNTTNLSPLVEIDYKPVWAQLAVDPAVYSPVSEKPVILANYQEGQVLLDSAWHQFWPYNSQCPNLGCTEPDNNLHALVGCVATAAGQIMRHWRWPPEGVGGSYTDSYDWVNMAPTLSVGSPQPEIDAVAELSHEVGVACSTDYGCAGSGAYQDDMVYAYENNFRYSTLAVIRYRSDYSAVEWFEKMKTQFNVNRPVQYSTEDHSLVSDGWRETGDPVVREYHFNYGWRNTGYNTWYVLDALYGGNPVAESMIENIKPACFLGAILSGTYAAPEYPYRYLDQDATCSTHAFFEPGQSLQFLHNITLKCTGPSSVVRIFGEEPLVTRLFTRGDRSKGVLITNGRIEISQNGCIRFP